MSLLSQSRAITAFVLSIGAIVSFSLLGCDSSDLDKQSFASSSSTANAYANGFRPLSENDALLESIEL
ncbi:MAG: hypothetical protein LBO72_01880, partial [Helicobacteraceae bacterium]|nr:hypothetical protein [Helicobacteraceae bacterium]